MNHTRMCDDYLRQFERAAVEAGYASLPDYVESYGHVAAPNRPVDDPSRPFASDDVEFSAETLVAK